MAISTNSVDEKKIVIMNEDHLLEGVSFTRGTVCEVISSSDSESYLKRVEDGVTLYVPNHKFSDYSI